MPLVSGILINLFDTRDKQRIYCGIQMNLFQCSTAAAVAVSIK